MTIWYAPAKLNLFLHVVGQLDDGYHDLQTVYQLIDWQDELEFKVTQNGRIRRPVEVDDIPEEQCLTVRAACALRERYPGDAGVDIVLRKSIPIGSGLGGGSSDAATTLVALNTLWSLNLSNEELADIGAKVGADVSVFIFGKNAWAEGRGEKLSNISLPRTTFYIVVPEVPVSTSRVFQEGNFTPFRARVSKSDFFEGNVGNDLEQTACKLYPEVEFALNWLSKFGSPRMSGSGGAVFLPIETAEATIPIAQQLPCGYQGRVCMGVGD